MKCQDLQRKLMFAGLPPFIKVGVGVVHLLKHCLLGIE